MIKLFQKPHFKESVAVSIILIIFFMILMFWFSVSQSFYIVFGSIAILFLPGFFFTFIFFPPRKIIFGLESNSICAIDRIERVILSIFFSITIIALILIIIRRLNIPLTPLMVGGVVIFANLVTMIGALIIFLRQKY